MRQQEKTLVWAGRAGLPRRTPPQARITPAHGPAELASILLVALQSALDRERTPSRDPHRRGTVQTDKNSCQQRLASIGNPAHDGAPERPRIQMGLAVRSTHPQASEV